MLSLRVPIATLAFALLAWTTVGCSDGSDSGDSCGVAGSTQACFCADGSSSAQSCGADGAWTPCPCGDGGGDAGGDTSGDATGDADGANPCDANPCGVGGTCTTEGGGFSCACAEGFEGATCVACGTSRMQPTRCDTTVGGVECERLVDDRPRHSLSIDCSATPDSGGCAGDQVSNADFAFTFANPIAISEVRLLSDWWTKRAKQWEVWRSDTVGEGPGTGATLVASGVAQENPWQCVSGEACDEYTPDDCCPNGRDQPQSIEEGALLSKHDILHFPADTSSVWWVRVVDAWGGGQLLLSDVRLGSPQCGAGTACLDSPCYPGVTCVDEGSGPVCGQCPSGTEGDGITCTPIDGCANNPCFPGVNCTDSNGSPVCGPCPSGTEGDGITCTPIDGCADNPCYPGVSCTNDGGNAVCGPCPSGTEGDGMSCSPIDGCADNPCFPGVTCTSSGGNPSCGACPSGFEGDGVSCADIDGCAGNPCYPGVTCTDRQAPQTGFDCGPCPAGLSGNGITCEVPPCSSDSNCSGGQSCFEGSCVSGSCENNCASTYGPDAWDCGSGGSCRVRECFTSAQCGSNECVSLVTNPLGQEYRCQSPSVSPCGGSCSPGQLCSEAAGQCAP